MNERAAAGDAVGDSDHEQHGRVITEQVVHQSQPLVPRQHLREQGLQQRPRVHLQSIHTHSNVTSSGHVYSHKLGLGFAGDGCSDLEEDLGLALNCFTECVLTGLSLDRQWQSLPDERNA